MGLWDFRPRVEGIDIIGGQHKSLRLGGGGLYKVPVLNNNRFLNDVP